MDDNNENDAQGNVTHLPASILDMPNEPFETICSFLDTSTLMNLPLVCKKFNSYINEISLKAWKRRAKYSIWADAVYPILSPANPDKLFWKMSCVALQKQKTLCTQNAHPLVNIATSQYRTQAEYLSSIQLICKNDDIACIIARDGNLYYKKINSQHSNIFIENAHQRPITDLTILNDKIYSCSTDNEPVKSWELNNGRLRMETSYNFNLELKDRPSCLSSHPGQYTFAVGSFHGYVSIFDSRSRNHVDQYQMPVGYRSMIYSLAMNSKYILSAMYGKKVFVYDQRKKEFLTDKNIPEVITCIKMQQNGFLIGDCVGKLHVLNQENNFEIENSYDIGHTHGIKGVHLTYGNLITSSTSEIIISSPTNPPRHMYTLRVPNVIKMDYQKNTLAVAINDNQIQIYQFVR